MWLFSRYLCYITCIPTWNRGRNRCKKKTRKTRMKMHQLPLDTGVHFVWLKHKLIVESRTLQQVLSSFNFYIFKTQKWSRNILRTYSTCNFSPRNIAEQLSFCSLFLPSFYFPRCPGKWFQINHSFFLSPFHKKKFNIFHTNIRLIKVPVAQILIPFYYFNSIYFRQLDMHLKSNATCIFKWKPLRSQVKSISTP